MYTFFSGKKFSYILVFLHGQLPRITGQRKAQRERRACSQCEIWTFVKTRLNPRNVPCLCTVFRRCAKNRHHLTKHIVSLSCSEFLLTTLFAARIYAVRSVIFLTSGNIDSHVSIEGRRRPIRARWRFEMNWREKTNVAKCFDGDVSEVGL